jgi:hypothetical protein
MHIIHNDKKKKSKKKRKGSGISSSGGGGRGGSALPKPISDCEGGGVRPEKEKPVLISGMW